MTFGLDLKGLFGCGFLVWVESGLSDRTNGESRRSVRPTVHTLQPPKSVI